MKSKQLPKPRNPFVQHLIVKKQGAHTKSYKVSRRDAKVALKKSSDYSDKPIASLSSLCNGPLVEWFNTGILIQVPQFDSERVHHYFDDILGPLSVV